MMPCLLACVVVVMNNTFDGGGGKLKEFVTAALLSTLM